MAWRGATRRTLPPSQVVLAKAWNKDDIGDSVNAKMIEFANRGFRSLGLARAEVRPAALLLWGSRGSSPADA